MPCTFGYLPPFETTKFSGQKTLLNPEPNTQPPKTVNGATSMAALSIFRGRTVRDSKSAALLLRMLRTSVCADWATTHDKT